jgi:hypothetical protein
MSDLTCTLAALYVHPIKSCSGLSPADSRLVETGLEYDREWMLVDEQGTMLTQRQHPRMALIQPAFKGGELVLRAPGMLQLYLSLDRVEAPTRARVWDDEVPAWDMGDLAALWCSNFLAVPARLVRFDPDHRRLSSPDWAGEVEALNAFADGFPLLLANTASLDDLNLRLTARGAEPVAMARFRPNLVVSGLEAYDEDQIDEIGFAAEGGTVRIRLVKPCARCSIPNVDLATGVTGTEPLDTLSGYRADARVGGGITFAMNAVVLEGFGLRLRVGQRGSATFAF